jgi:hypothetical protein
MLVLRLILVVPGILGSTLSLDRLPAQAAGPTRVLTADVKKKDLVTIRADARSAVVSFTSPSGIGEAVIRRTAEAWPRQVVLRLGLRGLEQVSILNLDADVTLRGSVLSHGSHRRLLEVAEGKKSSRVGQGSPYFTKIEAFNRKGRPAKKIPLDEGYFQMKIPAAMLKGNPEKLSIRWIDFYR